MEIEDFDENTRIRAYFVILYTLTLKHNYQLTDEDIKFENIFIKLYLMVNKKMDYNKGLIYHVYHKIVDINDENVIDISNHYNNMAKLKEIMAVLANDSMKFYDLKNSLDHKDTYYTEGAVRIFYDYYHKENHGLNKKM